MGSGSSGFVVLALAALASNWPFLSNRLLGVIRCNKTAWWRMAEWLVLYVVVGGIALALEQQQGQIYPQGWEFYAVTVFVFATFAFPGFVYRYLWRHRA